MKLNYKERLFLFSIVKQYKDNHSLDLIINPKRSCFDYSFVNSILSKLSNNIHRVGDDYEKKNN